MMRRLTFDPGKIYMFIFFQLVINLLQKKI